MKTLGISEFKAHALQLIDEVARTRQALLITKRGRPLARVVPYDGNVSEPVPGRLAAAFVAETDIVSPLGSEIWESNR